MTRRQARSQFKRSNEGVFDDALSLVFFFKVQTFVYCCSHKRLIRNII